MASISANGSRGHHKFTLTVTETSTSVDNNTSTISYSFKLSPISNGYNWVNWTDTNRTVSYTVNVNGTSYTGTIPNYDGSSTVTLKSGTQTVTHNADGTKTLSFSFSVTDTANGYNPQTGKYYTPGNASANGTMALTTLVESATGAAPIINAYVEDINDKTIHLTGSSSKLIKYHSTAYATMDVSPQGGASISKDRLIIRNGSETGYGDYHAFEKVESNVFTFSAEDNRGNVGTATVTAEMVDYVKLTCTMANSKPDASGNMYLSCSGNFFNGTFGAEDNDVTVAYICKGYGYYRSGEMVVSKSGNRYTAAAYLSDLDYQTTYDITITAEDKLEKVAATESGVKSKPIFHWGQNDFAFEVPVKCNGGLQVGNLSISNSTLESGTWTPKLKYGYSGGDYSGWYQKLGKCVVVGFNIDTDCYNNHSDAKIEITGLPYTPAHAAFGGGVAFNIYIKNANYCFEGWGATTDGTIVPRLQPCNSTVGNLKISSSAYYPENDSDNLHITLSGTICYMTS